MNPSNLSVAMLEQEKLSSSATVAVEVGDINDNNPLFQRESFTAEIQETASPGIKKEKLNLDKNR